MLPICLDELDRVNCSNKAGKILIIITLKDSSFPDLLMCSLRIENAMIAILFKKLY